MPRHIVIRISSQRAFGSRGIGSICGIGLTPVPTPPLPPALYIEPSPQTYWFIKHRISDILINLLHVIFVVDDRNRLYCSFCNLLVVVVVVVSLPLLLSSRPAPVSRTVELNVFSVSFRTRPQFVLSSQSLHVNWMDLNWKMRPSPSVQHKCNSFMRTLPPPANEWNKKRIISNIINSNSFNIHRTIDAAQHSGSGSIFNSSCSAPSLPSFHTNSEMNWFILWNHIMFRVTHVNKQKCEIQLIAFSWWRKKSVFIVSSLLIRIDRTDRTKEQTIKNRHQRNGKPFTNAFSFRFFVFLTYTSFSFSFVLYKNTAHCALPCAVYVLEHSWSCHVRFYLYLFNVVFCLFHLVSFALQFAIFLIESFFVRLCCCNIGFSFCFLFTKEHEREKEREGSLGITCARNSSMHRHTIHDL